MSTTVNKFSKLFFFFIDFSFHIWSNFQFDKNESD